MLKIHIYLAFKKLRAITSVTIVSSSYHNSLDQIPISIQFQLDLISIVAGVMAEEARA